MTNIEKLDKLITELKQSEDIISKVGLDVSQKREEIESIIKRESLGQYKNDVATVSRVERKNVKILDSDVLLKDIVSKNIVRYYKVVEAVPEHNEISPDLVKDVKDGKFQHEQIKVESSESIAIRFTK